MNSKKSLCCKHSRTDCNVLNSEDDPDDDLSSISSYSEAMLPLPDDSLPDGYGDGVGPVEEELQSFAAAGYHQPLQHNTPPDLDISNSSLPIL
jgi:hypothetical protein